MKLPDNLPVLSPLLCGVGIIQGVCYYRHDRGFGGKYVAFVAGGPADGAIGDGDSPPDAVMALVLDLQAHGLTGTLRLKYHPEPGEAPGFFGGYRVP